MFVPRALIGLIENPDSYAWQGYFLSFAMFATSVATCLCVNHHFNGCYVAGLRTRAALTAAIYRKVNHFRYYEFMIISVTKCSVVVKISQQYDNRLS